MSTYKERKDKFRVVAQNLAEPDGTHREVLFAELLLAYLQGRQDAESEVGMDEIREVAERTKDLPEWTQGGINLSANFDGPKRGV